jgi:hypothetical protein
MVKLFPSKCRLANHDKEIGYAVHMYQIEYWPDPGESDTY